MRPALSSLAPPLRRVAGFHRHCSSSTKGGAGSSTTTATSALSRFLLQHPIKAKMLSSCVIMGSGDLACQWITHRLERQKADEKEEVAGMGTAAAPAPAQAAHQYDLHRTFKFAFMGAALIGPMLHHWYGFLFRTFPGTSAKQVLKRLACDQGVFAPTFIPVFFFGLQLLDGNFSLDDIRAKLEADYLETLKSNYILWVPAMTINFRYVPPQYQVLWSNCVGFAWNIYLSYQSFRGPGKEEK